MPKVSGVLWWYEDKGQTVLPFHGVSGVQPGRVDEGDAGRSHLALGERAENPAGHACKAGALRCSSLSSSLTGYA